MEATPLPTLPNLNQINTNYGRTAGGLEFS